MFVHWSFSSFIKKNVIFLSELLDFSLKHPISIDEGVIGVFSLIDSHLQLLFDLFIWTHLFFQSGVLSLSFLILIFFFLFVLGVILMLLIFLVIFYNLLMSF